MNKEKDLSKNLNVDTVEPQTAYRNSIDALKTVYYVVIGLAITEALNRTFTKDGSFICIEYFKLNKFMLMLAFLFTICRFTHGASIHLGRFAKRKHKPIIDFAGFIFHGSLFYIMAIAIDKPFWFFISFVAMLLVDVAWLWILKHLDFITATSTENQWLKSDIIVLVAFGIFYFFDKSISSNYISFCILLVSFLAAKIDYRKNWDFYFSET